MLSKSMREKILYSDEFRSMNGFTYESVLREMQCLESIGGMIRGTFHRFVCLLQKMEAISPGNNAITTTLFELRLQKRDLTDINAYKEVVLTRNTGDLCLIAGLLLYLRLSDSFLEHVSLVESFLSDFGKIPVIDEQNLRTFTYLDVFVDDLLNKNKVLGIHLWNIPHKQP